MWYAAILGALVQLAGTLVGKALIALGIGFTVYKGVDTSISWAKTNVFASLSGLDPLTLQLLGVLQVGTAINILFSRFGCEGGFQGHVERCVQVAGV